MFPRSRFSRLFCLTSFLFPTICVFAVDKGFSKEKSPIEQLEYENKKAQALASFAKILNLLETQYVDADAFNMDATVEKAFSAMLSDLDPHSGYLSPQQLQKFIVTEPVEKEERTSVSISDLSHRVAYLKLSVFNGTSSQEVSDALTQFQESHHNTIQGLILDLRDNPGGLFDQSIQIANMFVDSGILVSTLGRDKQKPQQVEFAIQSQTFDNFPIIVLVNENTASSSEILAGALQDRDRALIMGSTTYGKGSVQKVVPLPNGGAIKFTIAQYYTPSGRSLQAEGVIPDVMFLPHGERRLKNYIQNQPLRITSNKKSVYQEIEEWNLNLREDEILKQAYLYLRQSL